MGMTITEKIIAAHAKKGHVQPGEIVDVDVDGVFVHDVFGPAVIDEFKRQNRAIWDSSKITMVIDHELPAVSENAGAGYQKMVEFSKASNIKHFYYGEGVCHQVIPEKGRVKPGELFIGADSHTVTYGALTAFSTGIGTKEMAGICGTGRIWLKVPETIKFVINGELPDGVFSKDLILYIIGKMKADGCVYKAVEYSGTAIEKLSMDARFTLANMTVEMGAKNAMIGFDHTTKTWVEKRGIKEYTVYANDPDAKFEEVHTLEAKEVVPQTAGPAGVDDVKAIERVRGTNIHQVFVGSCTNGRLEDLEIAAKIIKGRKIADYIKLIITPASKSIYLQAIERGLIRTFIDAGALVSGPGCGLCYGVHGGVLGKGEIAVCTNNRNFSGRLGHRDAKVYLASPATAVASAIEGKIADPRRYLRG